MAWARSLKIFWMSTLNDILTNNKIIQIKSVSSYSYCFTHGTKTLKWPKEGLSHSTVGFCFGEQYEDGDCYESHPHYMWVPLVVLFQAAISYIPHFLWYYWEGEWCWRARIF